MRYTIELGDYSADGHGMTETVHVDVPDLYSREDLERNYQKNVREWGFSPYQIAVEYGDNTIAPEHADKLLELGLDPTIFDDCTVTQELRDSAKERLGAYFRTVEKEYVVGTRGVDSERLIEIVMFYVGHGLEDFTWSTVRDSTPSLLGGWDGFSDDVSRSTMLGYGLFSH